MDMKNIPRRINRRAFIGTTGAAATGLTLIPGSLILYPLQQDNWWEKEPLRIVELEQGFEYGEKADLLKDLAANMEHVVRFTETSPGTSFIDEHNLFTGAKINFSTLQEYINEIHKRGIKVVIYYNVHAIVSSYALQHPEWQQIKDDGKPIDNVYSVDSSFCINSPWREEVFQTVRKLAGYEIDGIFYDGPIFFSNTCYCKHCKKLYIEKYGKEIPSKTLLSSKRDDPAWTSLLEFQSDCIAIFLRDTNRLIKDINPQILLYMNGNTLAPSWPTGRENRKIIRETDILGAEGGFLYGELAEPVYKPGATAKLLETQAEGKPTVVFDAAKQGPWTYSSLPPGELNILYSQTITHQGNVWLAVCNTSPRSHPEEMKVIQKYNSFIRDNPDPFHKTESLANIALLWPQRTGNYYSGSSVPLTDFTKEIRAAMAGNLSEEFYGFYDGLSRGHFPFDVIDEVTLNNDLSSYELIILPNAACISREERDKLKEFVTRGGNIISTFETSRFNESGRLQEMPLLSDLFGIKKTGDIFGPLNWDYITLKDKGHISFKDIADNNIYAPLYGLKTEPTSRAPVYFCKPLPGSYAASPEISEFPFIVENNYGSGKSFYFAGTFGGSLYKYRFPEYYRILSNLVNATCKPVVRMKNVPTSVEVNLRKKGNSLFLYLINFTSEMRRPIQRIIPVNGLEIELPVRENIKNVKALWSARELEFTKKDEVLSFILPEIQEYEVIRISI